MTASINTSTPHFSPCLLFFSVPSTRSNKRRHSRCLEKKKKSGSFDVITEPRRKSSQVHRGAPSLICDGAKMRALVGTTEVRARSQSMQ